MIFTCLKKNETEVILKYVLKIWYSQVHNKQGGVKLNGRFNDFAKLLNGRMGTKHKREEMKLGLSLFKHFINFAQHCYF